MSERFQRGLRRLTGVFIRYDDTRSKRSVERLDELVATRLALEAERTNMHEVRKADGVRITERTSPEFVDPTVGLGDTSNLGKVAGVIAIIILAIGVVLVAEEVRRAWDAAELTASGDAEAIHENGSGTCDWVTTVTLTNGTGQDVDLRAITLATSQRSDFQGRVMPEQSGFQQTRLEPGESTRAVVSLRLDGCPAKPSDIRHGPLSVTYATTGHPSVTTSFGIG